MKGKKKVAPTIEEKKIIEEIEETPMTDEDIRSYFPNIKTISYHDLKNYSSINQILPKNKSYCIILYESGPNSGHWTALMRYNNTIEFFCSYGSSVDECLKWISPEQNKALGIYEPYLTNLLLKSKMKVIYNPIQYQKEKKKKDVNTCGRYCILRIQKMLDGFDLQSFYKLLYLCHKKFNIDYDKLVSSLITKVE